MVIDDDILIKYIDDNLSEEEKAEVETWRKASPANENIIEQTYYTLQLTKRLKIMHDVDADKAFVLFKARRKRQQKRVGLSISWLDLERIAAILFIPLLLLSGYLLLRNEVRSMAVETRTNPGIVSTVNLPDGSKVWLNTNSSLKYEFDSNTSKRVVELSGEGFFEVKKDVKKPFVVNVGSVYSVEVTGTSFNISAYPEEDIIRTTLVEGSVKVEASTANGKSSCMLKPDEKAEYQKGNKQLDVKNTDTTTDTDWVKGEIIFKQEPMDNVLKKLSRHYNTEFDVKNQEIMKAIITARFKNESLPQVMEYLKVASGLKYTIHTSHDDDGNTISIVEIYK